MNRRGLEEEEEEEENESCNSDMMESKYITEQIVENRYFFG